MLEAGGAAPSGAVPSGGLLFTDTVTVPVTVSVTVTVRFVRVCSLLFAFVCVCSTKGTLVRFVRVCSLLFRLDSPLFLPASDRLYLSFS